MEFHDNPVSFQCTVSLVLHQQLPFLLRQFPLRLEAAFDEDSLSVEESVRSDQNI